MTPRLRLIQQLSLASLHATRSDPEWIADVEKALFLARAALTALVEPQRPVPDVGELALRAARGEGLDLPGGTV